MKKALYIIAFIFLTFATSSCKKIPDGNLSPLVRYEELPVEIPQGRAFVSTAINPEGSSKPLKFTLLKVYNRESGEDVTKLFTTKYQHKVWKGLYDSKIDTTLEMIEAKRKDSLIYPISINPLSGQIEANYTTVNLPLGKYKFDLKAENAVGERIFNGVGEFDLIAAPTYEISAVRSTVAMKVGEESTTKSIPSNDSHQKVTRVSDKEDRIILRIKDKNGNVFNPKKGEIGKRPRSGTEGGYLQTLQDYSLSTTLYDDRIEFTYGVVPFPLASLGNGFNYYYRIPSKYVQFDESLGLPYNTYSCNFRFSFQTFAPGTYEIDVIVPQVVRVP